jgi:hypothetical protein
VQGDTGLMRGVEFHLVADGGGEGDTDGEEQREGTRPGVRNGMVRTAR